MYNMLLSVMLIQASMLVFQYIYYFLKLSFVSYINAIFMHIILY